MHRLFLLGVLSKVYVSNPIPGPYIWWEGEGGGGGRGWRGYCLSPSKKLSTEFLENIAFKTPEIAFHNFKICHWPLLSPSPPPKKKIQSFAALSSVGEMMFNDWPSRWDSVISQFDISELLVHVGIKCKIHETLTKERNEVGWEFIIVPLLSCMNISFYPDARMHFWNVELAYRPVSYSQLPLITMIIDSFLQYEPRLDVKYS